MVMGNPVRKFTDYNNQDEQKSKENFNCCRSQLLISLVLSLTPALFCSMS